MLLSFFKSERNRYDWGIILLIILLVFGGVGGALQPVRVFALIFAPFVLLQLFYLRVSNREKKVFLFFSFWLFLSVLSLFWTLDQHEGLKQIVYYATHYILFFQLILWSKKANNARKSIAYGWVVLLLITLPIALYEIITLNHLAISRFDSSKMMNISGQLVPYRHASVTFMNHNTYVVVMLFCIPFLLSVLLRVKSVTFSIVLWFGLFTSIGILLVNSSRGGLLSVLIYLFLFAIYKLIEHKFTVKKIIVLFFVALFLIVLGYFLLAYTDVYFSKSLSRASSGLSSFASDSTRFEIYWTGLKLLIESNLIGNGVGSEIAALESTNLRVHSSHNLIMELVIQFGVIILIGFLWFLSKIFSSIFYETDNSYRIVLLGAFFAFIPLFIINSGYLLMPSFWVFLSSLFVYSSRVKCSLKSSC